MKPIQASVLLLTYNQEAYVTDAFESLLSQDEEALEIVVSDDASSDATWERLTAIAEKYTGPKRLVLNRNSKNLGVVGNYYKAFELSSGELIFTAAGDDISMPDRCSATIARWRDLDGKADLIASDGFDMALDGCLLGDKKTDDLNRYTFADWVKQRPFIFGASHMMTRRLVGLRPLSFELPYEDQNFLARALMMGGAANLRMQLVKHRRGGISQTKTKFSIEQKRNRLIQSASAALLECDEIVLDAHMLGIVSIETLLNEPLKLNNYVVALLKERFFWRQIEIARQYKSVAIRKHIKFLGFAIREQLSRLLSGAKGNQLERGL